MRLYTYSDARQNFSEVLDAVSSEGKVLIRRRDGSLFSITPEKKIDSPFDVEGISTAISTEEIVSTLRAGRQRF
ncbi:MAG: type II toxin-antitoxin system Phd/YefM family antitoxin [Verrucomicrobiales bacterium]|nr:type II toxin-antitoxin system Phd/YefM family antitoxin [Verrucomicrobiales bacterium]